MEFNALIPELSVSDINKSKDFYLSLGFEIKYERPENKFVFLQLEDNQIMIEQINGNWSVGEMHYPFGNGINCLLEVDDIYTIYNNLQSHNYKIAFDVEENWYRQGAKLLGNKEFLVQDPDGYLLRFSQDLGQKDI